MIWSLYLESLMKETCMMKIMFSIFCAVALIRKRKVTDSIWNGINRQLCKLSATVNFLDQTINGDLIVEYSIPFILKWMLDSSIPRKITTNYRQLEVQIMFLSLLATVSFSSFSWPRRYIHRWRRVVDFFVLMYCC